MKSVLFLALAVAVVVVSCHPAITTEEQPQPRDVFIEQPLEEGRGLRLKRATCDGGSFESKWFTPRHSLCAAHCLLMRYKGGSCKGTICHCRDKF